MDKPGMIEKYYRGKDVALLLDFSDKWVLQRVKAGDFGSCFYVAGDWRIPASGVNAFINRHAVARGVVGEPVPARTEGELRRKLANSPNVCTP
jgi:hypothetical protein